MAKNKIPTIDVDGNWKSLIECAPADFLQFFMPKIYEKLDFDREISFLEQEMRGLKGRKIVDKLCKVPILGGGSIYILVHVEVQGQVQPNFDLRMFEYGALAFLKLQMQIEAIAIFVGSSKPTNNGEVVLSSLENQSTYRYKIYHVFDQSEEELLAMDNVFALAILANRYMLQTTANALKRLELRKKIFLLAKKRGFSLKTMLEILTFALEMLRVDDTIEAAFIDFIKIEKFEDIMGLAAKRKPRLGMINIYHTLEYGVSFEQHLKEQREKEKIAAEKEKQFRKAIVKLSEELNIPVQQIAVLYEIEVAQIEQILKEESDKKDGKK